MGTRWRGLLAPINVSTGDGRRLAEGGGSWRELPNAMKWQRLDAGGHDDSVAIGSTDTMNIGTVADAIANGWISDDAVAKTMQPDTLGLWGGGELFDDVNAAEMPRLAQDVAEVKHLLAKKVIGPSIDPAAVTSVLVRVGSDTPLTGDELDELWMEAMESGTDPAVEELYTTWQVANATLVLIPAFEECRPFELLGEVVTVPAQGATTAPAGAASVTATGRTSPSLVATLTRTEPLIPADVFAVPAEGTGYQPLRVEDRGEGFLRVFGHVAPAGQCHLEFRDTCMTPPMSKMDYTPFHRYPVEVGDGELIGAGRITTGFGKVGTGCRCCPGKGDHACGEMTLSQAINHYDRLTTLAYVRAADTDGGPWVAGYVLPGLDKAAMRMLTGGPRVRVSGDWREHAGGLALGGNPNDLLELVEVLALSGADREGFPPPRVSVHSGRRFSLTAGAGWGGAPPVTDINIASVPAAIDYQRLGEVIGVTLADRGIVLGDGTLFAAKKDAKPAEEPVDEDAEPEHTGAMIALRMADDRAASLTVDGGEPADELHDTLFYLGEASAWSEDNQAALIEAMKGVAAGLSPFEADPFGVAIWSPDDPEGSCVIQNISGQALVDAHDQVAAAVGPFLALVPEQHAPKLHHITLAYTQDTALLADLATRPRDPIQFDRLRIAFAGQVTDLTLGGEPADPAEQAAQMAAQVDEALAWVDAEDRAAAVAQIMNEMESLDVLR